MNVNIEEIITLLNIDTLTLVVGGVLVVLATVALVCSPYIKAFRPESSELSENSEPLDISEEPSEPTEKPLPCLSILLTPHDNAEQLARHLDAYLSQDYPSGYEVIVVTWRGDHETDDILKRYATDKRLYTTYIPDSSRYMPREKLAVTLGVKAAKNEWVVLADIACRPDSDQWLKTLADGIDEQINLVLTHTRYEEDTTAFRRFERLYKELYTLKEARSGTAYRANDGCLMFRKSEFMAGEGYRGNLKYLRGEFDFLVNKYAREGATALMLHSRAWLTEDEPSTKHWRNRHLFYQENRQHLERSFRHRLAYNIHQTLLHVNLLLELAAIAFGALTEHWLLVGVACMMILLSYIVRTVMAHKVMRAWDEHISSMTLFFKELRLFWFALGVTIRYRRANKNDFISHKI